MRVRYPPGFEASQVDATVTSRVQWVADLVGQRIKHFECQTPIVQHEPLDGEDLSLR